MLSRMVTPFVVAPGLATVTMLAFAMHVQVGRLWIIAAALTLGVLCSWIGEVAGGWQRNVSAVDGALVLHWVFPSGG